MASVKTLHEIVTQDTVYPAGEIVVDMPQSLIDEMKPLGAVELIEDAAPVEVVVAAQALAKKQKVVG